MSIVAIRRIVVTAGLVLLLVPSPASAETSERSETTAETEVLESTGSAESLVSQDIQSDPVAVLDGTSRSEAITPEVADPVLVEPDTPETSDTPDTSDTSETPEPDESNEADESIDEAASTTEEPLPVPTDWSGRVNEIASRIRIGASEASAADALYRDLTAELWAYQDEVFEALRSRSPDALSQRDILDRMYDARMRLLEWVTPELRGTMIGGGSRGMRELGNEIENAKLDFYFQTLAIPRGLRRIADDIRDSPLDDLGRFIELLFGVIVFRVWRRWAKEGIPKTRARMLAMRPPTDAHLRAARLLWYLQRFRSPLEWLALLVFVSAIYVPGDLEEVTTLLSVVILWFLLARFGLLLVDALASRSVDGPASQNAALRLRSLRIVTAWVLFTGLSLDLSSRYVGEGAIYAWVGRAFTLLLVPILLVLLHGWRAEIIRRLGEEARHSNLARRLSKRQKGLGSYLNAAAGGIYLIGARLLQSSIRVMSGFEGGRKVVATLLRREVERDGQRESISEQRISEELRLKLLTPDGTVIDGPFREGLERIEALATAGRGATIAVLAERGGGMSDFLRLMKNDLGDRMRIVDCPPGGIESFRDALTEEFGLNRTADLTVELRPRLDELGVRVIAVDNFHRVARPMMGGLTGLDETSKISEAAGDDITWVVAVTRSAWPYITRARGDGAILQDTLELPRWSEAQLEQLFEARCKAAEIEPDYRRLVFPRQFDDGERTTLDERNRFGFRRILWELSDGNPEVAIRLFCDSLRELPDGKLIVRLPQPASVNTVANANLTTLLVLRGLVECELASIDDLTASIRVSRLTVANAIAYCLQQGWVEEVYDHYQITWDWYRTIKRVLIRRNLIAR
jgi:hypothetical protein